MRKSIVAPLILLALVAALGAHAPAQQTVQSRPVRPAAVTGDLLDLANVNDGRVDTRATSGRADYVGLGFTVDIGSEQNIIGVAQDHGRWPTHYPGAYKVEVAAAAQGPWMLAWQGEGQRGESKAKFEAIRGRYVRVTATAVNPVFKQEWSVAEITAGIDPGQKPRTIPTPAQPRQPEAVTPAPASRELKEAAKATDGKLDTFASTNAADYAGMYIVYDLGGEYELSRVLQLHGARADDYPAEYKVEISRERNEDRFREVWRGAGQAGRSVARFDPVVTRYVRITALRARGGGRPWSIAELRTNRDPDVIEHDAEDDHLTPRPIRGITSQGLTNVNAIVDDNNTTRAATTTANYAGAWVQADLGGSYTVSRVVQVHEPDARDFPGRYRVEVSGDGNRWQTVFEGAGERGRSVATFTPVRARFVRITATANLNNRAPWSLYKLRIRG